MNRIFVRQRCCMAAGFLVAVQLPVAHAQAPAPSTGDSNRPVKLSPGLEKELVDTSVNPCDNFVQYACGNFTKLYPIPPDLPGYDSLFMDPGPHADCVAPIARQGG